MELLVLAEAQDEKHLWMVWFPTGRRSGYWGGATARWGDVLRPMWHPQPRAGAVLLCVRVGASPP